jgi:hypothetical protein
MSNQVVVEVDQAGVSSRRPGGLTESVLWEDLSAVFIETTDQGPFEPDLFWILVGEDSGCVVPIGAVGEEDLLNALQGLPGFDNEAVMAAMTSVTNQRFTCWKRKD